MDERRYPTWCELVMDCQRRRFDSCTINGQRPTLTGQTQVRQGLFHYHRILGRVHTVDEIEVTVADFLRALRIYVERRLQPVAQ